MSLDRLITRSYKIVLNPSDEQQARNLRLQIWQTIMSKEGARDFSTLTQGRSIGIPIDAAGAAKTANTVFDTLYPELAKATKAAAKAKRK